MKWNTLPVIGILCWGILCIGKVTAQDEESCTQVVFVESPTHDTYVNAMNDTARYGKDLVLRLRGTPDKKKMMGLLTYQVHHVDANYVKSVSLKVYTASKKNVSNLTVTSFSDSISERHTTFRNHPLQRSVIASQAVSDAPYIEFDVTEYVKDRLKEGIIRFGIETDGKKVIEVSSRESGLCSELAIVLCTAIDRSLLIEHNNASDSQYNMDVLPSTIPGKFTIQMVGVPAGGFGDLLIMNEGGDVLRQFPIAVRKGDVLYYTLDFGDLMPGDYWAMFRKGRILIKDEFRMRPSKSVDRMIEVEFESTEVKVEKKE